MVSCRTMDGASAAMIPPYRREGREIEMSRRGLLVRVLQHTRDDMGPSETLM